MVPIFHCKVKFKRNIKNKVMLGKYLHVIVFYQVLFTDILCYVKWSDLEPETTRKPVEYLFSNGNLEHFPIAQT